MPEHPNIIIRPYTLDDVPAMYAAVRESIAEVAAWLSWCHAEYTEAEAREYIASRAEARSTESEYGFAICDAMSGEYLGGVGLNQINRAHLFANLGYWVRTGATGRGVATQATRLMARFAFEELGMRRVEIVAAVGNLASQRVAERAGARREGVLRRRLLHRGVSHDAVMFSFVAEDFDEELSGQRVSEKPRRGEIQ